MASLLYRWLVVRWVDTVYPDGDHGVENVESLAVSANDRALDVRYHDMDEILGKLREGITLAQSVLAERTAGFLRSNTLVTPYDENRKFINSAHPHGITMDAEAGTETTTLEATFRHMYFEETTHLYNISAPQASARTARPSSKSPASATGCSTAGTGASRVSCAGTLE